MVEMAIMGSFGDSESVVEISKLEEGRKGMSGLLWRILAKSKVENHGGFGKILGGFRSGLVEKTGHVAPGERSWTWPTVIVLATLHLKSEIKFQLFLDG